MGWKFKRKQMDGKETRVPVCDVLLPLPGPREMARAVGALFRLQLRPEGPLNLAIHLEPGSRTALRIRGFAGINLDVLSGFLRAMLTHFKSADSVTLSYGPGCLGRLARPDGGILQISTSCIASHALSEERAKSLGEPPGELLLAFPEAGPTLH